MDEYAPTDNSMVIKIYREDIEHRHMSQGGIVTTNLHRPLMDMCQVGEVYAVGNRLKDRFAVGDMVLFSHSIQDDAFRLLHTDAEQSEYRVVKDGIITSEILGKISTGKRGKEARIIPHENYIVATPEPHHSFDLTKSIFQVIVSYVNPADSVARKMGIKVGDWIICMPNAAYSIIVKRKEFYFIFLEDILAINHGIHRLAVLRQHVSKDIRMASRPVLTNLN